MAPNTVFDSFVHTTNVDHENRNKSEFDILNNAHYAEAEATRTIINHLFGSYPVSEKNEIRARLRSGDDEAFRSALFEMIIYHAITAEMGMNAEPHPKLPNGATERPDFLVTTSDGEKFYLEATMAQDRVESSKSGEKIVESMIQAVDAVPNNDFVLQLRFTGSPTNNPKLSSLKRFVATQLAKLSYDKLRIRFELGDQLDDESFTWKFEGGSVRMVPRPVLPEYRNSTQCRVATTSGYGGGWRDGMMPIYRKLDSKRKHYDVLDHPLVVALDCASILMRNDELITALFGSDSGSSTNSAPIGFSGVFDAGQNSKRPLAAVWVFHRVNPTTLIDFDHCLIVNQLQPVNLSEELFQLPHYIREGEYLSLISGLSSASLMSKFQN